MLRLERAKNIGSIISLARKGNDEMGAMHKETPLRIRRIQDDIAKGMGKWQACLKEGMTTDTFNKWADKFPPTKKTLALAAKPNKRGYKKRKLLNVQDLPPMPVQGVPGIFMVFGSPELLASFAKGMQ